MEEVYQIVIKYGSRLFPDSAGILSLLTSTNHLSMVSGWGLQTIAKKTFIANACQALRHHPLHATDNQHTDASCEHLHNDKLSDHLCMPLVAQGKIIGLLSITYPSIFRQYKMTETDHLLAVAMSEQVGLALANAKLRQTLYQQSMFDPLTGLYNRRYLTDMLKADLISTQKNHGNIAFIMIDIDFFKHFNDKYGHDAGDQVLVQTSKLLTASLSPDSHACRFGGEEFIVVLKNTSLEAAKRWAEKLCETIKLNPIQHKGVTLDTITLSIGIAVFPAHGQDVNQLLVAADLALYQAKGAGRNQVVICEISLGGNSTGMDAKKDQAID
jgi:diguanylate cyclase (GGDEF)-like protein